MIVVYTKLNKSDRNLISYYQFHALVTNNLIIQKSMHNICIYTGISH